jgi:hypothetical protein
MSATTTTLSSDDVTFLAVLRDLRTIVEHRGLIAAKGYLRRLHNVAAYAEHDARIAAAADAAHQADSRLGDVLLMLENDVAKDAYEMKVGDDLARRARDVEALDDELRQRKRELRALKKRA